MGPGVGRGVGGANGTVSVAVGVGSTLGVVAVEIGAGVLVAFCAVMIVVGVGLAGAGLKMGVGTSDGVALVGVGIAVGVGSFGERVGWASDDVTVESGSDIDPAGFGVTNAGSAGFGVGSDSTD